MTQDPVLRFGRFEIRPAERVLRIDGEAVAVGARAFDLLLALAQRRECMVTKQELLDLVWPGLVVEEHNIAAQLSTLRKLLGPGVVATVPGRGYRFTAVVEPSATETRAGAADPPRPRHNLPEQRTRFIGRDAVLAELARLLPQTRLLTLTGVGGCGKTRLALQFAQQRLADFVDGVWFVDLAPLNAPQRVAAACAAVLQIDAGDEAATTERLAQVLAARQALLLLDNCEHVRDGAAALVDAVLARAGRSRLLATSREPLAVAGEQLYPVRSLSLPATPALDDVRAADSVRVFVDRARLTMPEFEVDASNAATVAEICRRLDGIALAIELAAARVAVLSPADIAARLQDRFRLLTGGQAPSERQQTLLATMRWSDDLLPPDEQRLLRQLSVFAGGCTLPAAAAVAQDADEYATLARLSALHAKSLLIVDRDPASGGNRSPRYRLLETVRQYAQQRLADLGEADAARARHAAFFLALAEDAAPHLRGPQQSRWMARLRNEQENLVAALAWCSAARPGVDPQSGLRLVAATARYWLFHEVELGSRLALTALQRDAGGDSPARLETLLGLAAMYMHRGRGEEGLAHAREALSIAQRVGAVEAQARALVSIGACLRRDGEGDALRYYEQARDLARAGGHVLPLESALNNMANIDFEQGRWDRAVQGYRESLHLARARGDLRSTLIVLHNLIRVLVAARRHDDARQCAVEAGQLLAGVGEDVLKFEWIEVTAGLAASRGEHEIAARFWGAAIHRFTDAGFRRPEEDERQLRHLSAEARRSIGEAAFERAEAAGRALGVDAAMREVGQWLERSG